MMEFDDVLLSAVRQGDINLLESRLSTVTNPDLYLNRVYDEAGEQKCTLMMIACLNGHENIIRMLLDRFKPNLEVLNNVILEGAHAIQEMFSNVSILWVTTVMNNLELVKLLVEHGADVNHTTKTNSTPLRGACYHGNLDMVRYLIRNGADIHIAKENNDTNLMLSANRGHLNMVIYLVDELKCDVNLYSDDGRSSLYDAVYSGSLELVKFLLSRRARNFRAIRDQMSPLMWAAEKRYPDLVDALSHCCLLPEQIEAKELLGSAFVCATGNDINLEQGFEYFYQALELRLANNIPKVLRSTVIEIFDNRQECQTLNQLEEIRSNIDNMYTEALLIRERLLGSANEEYRNSILYRGCVLADNGQYHRTVTYWMYELNLRQQNSISLDSKNLREFGSLFGEMLFKSMSIPIDALLKLMMVIIEELEHKTKEFTYNLHTLLFLITTIIQSLTKSVVSEADHRTIYRLLHSINQRQYTTPDYGLSLLHLSLDTHTAVPDYHLDRICEYPCLQTVRTLILCGADVNAIDAVRNTPLHILVSNELMYDISILNILCDAGAHLDYVNALRETPLDLASNPIIKKIIKSRMKLSLKCLCARLIQKNSIPFHGKISTSLINFVEKH